MRVGDLVQIRKELRGEEPHEAVYDCWLFDEIMLVTDVISHTRQFRIDPVVECISKSGTYRFPVDDMKVI